MEKTIIVTKNGNEQVLYTEFLQNNDVVIKKSNKGKDFEITLHRFSNEEIEELRKTVDEVYSKMSENRISGLSTIKKIEQFFKK